MRQEFYQIQALEFRNTEKEVELKSLREELEGTKNQLTVIQGQLDLCKEDKFDLTAEVRKVTDKKEQVERDLRNSKDEVDRLNK